MTNISEVIRPVTVFLCDRDSQATSCMLARESSLDFKTIDCGMTQVFSLAVVPVEIGVMSLDHVVVFDGYSKSTISFENTCEVVVFTRL